MVRWITENITKFRPTGTQGNNFSARKQSHGPIGGATTSLGGFGERKFSGYTTKSSLASPSRTNMTTMKILKPLQLARQASLLHEEQDALLESDSPNAAAAKKSSM
jgi:hypothetical protein